eukprot:CAMPEP_0113468824 /NCGR_PEP_ID=MMETSP0014_2-20120614/15565_1 /TAXON_ID=2857 /ORGANISM="Nitzschia sp." /LENGTH=70 /DNA_ID=CAMNT_0000361247 /DNA_START=500 /DNA_END=709 /DNA_ORIENTATION=- /assembly_acc=CAM_ASM_000159
MIVAVANTRIQELRFSILACVIRAERAKESFIHGVGRGKTSDGDKIDLVLKALTNKLPPPATTPMIASLS